MMNRFFARMVLLTLSSRLLLPVFAAEPAVSAAGAESQEKAAKPYHVSPGPADGQIAYYTARMLQEMHYLHQTFDEGISSKFLDRYLEALDPQHLHFTQRDKADFEHYSTNLNHLTINKRREADTRPGCEIFERYVQRLQQRVAYADELLKKENFAFDADERIAINRHELPYPKDLDEAKALWRDRLRFEYLQEKLAKLDARKKAEAAKN